MGMFNYVIVEGDWLPSELAHDEFQTKEEIEELFCETFKITKEGRLMFERREYEWHPDIVNPEKFSDLAGALKTTKREWIDENYHGDFRFHSGKIYCVARFTHGQLEYITYGVEE